MKNSDDAKQNVSWLIRILAPALQAQFSLALGFLFCLGTSYFYFFIKDSRFPLENPTYFWVGFLLSALSFLIGNHLAKKKPYSEIMKLRDGAITVVFTWLIACIISATVYYLAGFPDPLHPGDYSFIRKFIDGFFESMSGFTTTGSSILPSIEVFPRGVLMWRAVTHWIGGMGIAYLAVTLWKRFSTNIGQIINSEAETPNMVVFKSKEDGRKSGYDFLKVYGVLTVSLFILLCLSGHFLRSPAYATWYDNVYDSIYHTFGTLGTGGFSSYDKSVGLPETQQGSLIVGGLHNPASEWIIAIYLILAGANFSVLYILLFQKNIKETLKNQEFKTYLFFVGIVTLGIFFSIESSSEFIHSNSTLFGHWTNTLRYSFFNVASIISTAGFGNSDFTKWPAAAQALLFSCYLVGGCVGSTGGGLKFTRFIILFKVIKLQIRNFIHGTEEKFFYVDGVKYDLQSSNLVVVNIAIYFLIFLGGAIMIMLTSASVLDVNGVKQPLDLISAISAALTTLGNIGPAAAIGSVNAGPTGNFAAYSDVSKLFMSILMLIGRIGVLTFVAMFISKNAETKFSSYVPQSSFDSDAPLLKV